MGKRIIIRKGGGHKGSTQSALSALTLLAFLFFLNILQSCLRDQMLNQVPITIMMTTTTTSTTTSEGQRLKRETDKNNYKGHPPTFKKETTDSTFDNSADRFSAWIYDRVCCKDCEPKNIKSKKETFENYLRKSVIMICELFEADSAKTCQNESEYSSNQGYKDETSTKT
ncbi:uncharacterized protein LOC106670180 [Cimex lectularius]|uniref:Uncharacterized protein n=1 Tax=Cimex lectularius TaxID=79782 RepID=A0A8I6S094_CIMLE|nr:uncharacterized protein LOC106670180 [Cimex lectularius]